MLSELTTIFSSQNMEDEVQDHLSDTLDLTLFPHLAQVDLMDLACPQEVTCQDHQVL